MCLPPCGQRVLAGMVTVAFTGAGGGKMAPLADHLFAVASTETARIQEAHMLAGHMLCDWIELDWVHAQSGEEFLARLADGRRGIREGRFPGNNGPERASVQCAIAEAGARNGGGAVIEQLHEAIDQIEHEWPAKRLLVVGDLMLDKYIWGEVGRISPEAPVPVVRARGKASSRAARPT